MRSLKGNREVVAPISAPLFLLANIQNNTKTRHLHVTDGCHTSAGERFGTRAVVLNNGTSSTLDGKDTSDLEDDICLRISIFQLS
jgi:hypothetical protein